jgi:hypothetical protein
LDSWGQTIADIVASLKPTENTAASGLAMRRDEQFEPFRIQWAWIGFALVMALLLWAQVSDIWRMIFG